MDEGLLVRSWLTQFPTRVINYEKVVELSDEDFAGFYLELMEEYRDVDGWWGDGKIPCCTKCRSEISGPEFLRRYHGGSYHPDCFREFYAGVEKEKGVVGQFWDRVAELE